MKCVHVKNIEKYNPGFKDRNLIWCKLYFSTLNTDQNFMLLCEVDKWRYFAFVILELQIKKPVPLDQKFLTMKGFDFRKRPIHLTLNMLHEMIEVRDILISSRYQNDTQSRVEESRVDKNRTEHCGFDELTLNLWNELCDGQPKLKRIKEISDSRKKRLDKLYKQDSFKNFKAILDAIPSQPFLLGNGDSGWVITYDWLIKNDTNYLKVLEGTYKRGAERKML